MPSQLVLSLERLLDVFNGRFLWSVLILLIFASNLLDSTTSSQSSSSPSSPAFRQAWHIRETLPPGVIQFPGEERNDYVQRHWRQKGEKTSTGGRGGAGGEDGAGGTDSAGGAGAESDRVIRPDGMQKAIYKNVEDAEKDRVGKPGSMTVAQTQMMEDWKQYNKSPAMRSKGNNSPSQSADVLNGSSSGGDAVIPKDVLRSGDDPSIKVIPKNLPSGTRTSETSDTDTAPKDSDSGVKGAQTGEESTQNGGTESQSATQPSTSIANSRPRNPFTNTGAAALSSATTLSAANQNSGANSEANTVATSEKVLTANLGRWFVRQLMRADQRKFYSQDNSDSILEIIFTMLGTRESISKENDARNGIKKSNNVNETVEGGGSGSAKLRQLSLLSKRLNNPATQSDSRSQALVNPNAPDLSEQVTRIEAQPGAAATVTSVNSSGFQRRARSSRFSAHSNTRLPASSSRFAAGEAANGIIAGSTLPSNFRGATGAASGGSSYSSGVSIPENSPVSMRNYAIGAQTFNYYEERARGGFYVEFGTESGAETNSKLHMIVV
jgi:hypothetical protein